MMETNWIIPVLSLGTLLIVLAIALVSKARTEARRHDPRAPTSTLAKDGKFGGVAPVVEDGLAGAPAGREARVGAAKVGVGAADGHPVRGGAAGAAPTPPVGAAPEGAPPPPRA